MSPGAAGGEEAALHSDDDLPAAKEGSPEFTPVHTPEQNTHLTGGQGTSPPPPLDESTAAMAERLRLLTEHVQRLEQRVEGSSSASSCDKVRSKTGVK